MLLRAGERLLLLAALPEQGDITTIRIVAELRQDLGFTEAEFETYGIRTDDEGRVHWIEVGDGREYEFGAKAREQIVKALTKMSDEGKLTGQHMTVCDKFGIGE